MRPLLKLIGRRRKEYGYHRSKMPDLINRFLHWCMDSPGQVIGVAVLLWLTLPALFDLVWLILYLAPDYATLVFFSPHLLF